MPAPAAMSIARIVDLYEAAQLEQAVKQARLSASLHAGFGWAPTFDDAGRAHVTRGQFAELRVLASYKNPEPTLFPDGSSVLLYGIPVVVDE
jgi:hypothetical protein